MFYINILHIITKHSYVELSKSNKLGSNWEWWKKAIAKV